ncbi:M23 family metallopeptidase [Aeromicrobium wangtongii]|uniref:M23 family metallopeptidase n=1 Tax=Aeromicrobium wangtongii TaxID=2969247 RepID=UPI002017BF69|nr:M23 family metallopeptidase [Aeromicrobium wangtongii]MCL3819331.1 M23 family metallopeptidase [Aeromicrobium wangtongii]
MLGVVAVTAAGLGSLSTHDPEVAGDTLITQAYEAAQTEAVQTAAPSTPTASPEASVDVSRSYDRPPMEEATAELIEQRTAALEAKEQAIAAQAAAVQQEQERQAQEQARQAQEQARQAQARQERRAKRAEQRRIQQAEKRRNGWVKPVSGYTLTARFGQQSSLWSSGAHTGLDFAGPSGSKLVSMSAGRVTEAGYAGAYGNRTVITMADGTEIWYCHQSRIVANVGEKVSPGELIGYTGSTGNVTGPHLHLEVRPGGGGPVDPAAMMRKHGINP